MAKLLRSEDRWAHLSTHPRLLCRSDVKHWRGFDFQEIQVPAAGSFARCDARDAVLSISQTCGPMRVRYGGPRSVFHDLPTDPQLKLPGTGSAGAWQGTQRGLHLFVLPEMFERLGHAPFKAADLPAPVGPNPILAHLLRALHIDVLHRHPSGPILGETVLAALINYLLPASDAGQTTTVRTSASKIDFIRARDWIEANLAHVISLEDLAAELNVSVRFLHRAFAGATGLSPYRFIMMQRVERARQLIQAGELTLVEIAARTGFCDQAHMARTFRSLIGASPSQFGNTAT